MANAPPPKSVDLLDTPCLVVDVEKVKRNCARMQDICKRMNVTLRPMMKTHKTVEIADIMTSGSKRCIEGSTIVECEFYADHGYDDILFTGIFTQDKVPRLQALAVRLSLFHVMLDAQYGLDLLEAHPLPNGEPWSVFLMVNVGGNRSGVEWDGEEALLLAQKLHTSAAIRFQGLYGHEGSASYSATNKEEIESKSNTSAERICTLADRLRSAGVAFPCVGLGSTPSCSQPGTAMSRLTEFHPGNYCFYDAMQAMKGSCGWDDIAARVATRVTGHYPESNQILIDAGFLAVSFDGPGAFGDKGSYALIEGHPELKLFSMHQEVGFVSSVDGKPLEFSKYPVGSMLFLLPWHSCTTACAHSQYIVYKGDQVVDVFKPCTGW